MRGHLRCSLITSDPSSFCVVPARGDNLFSVRFSEILSAGCIPIIYADGWVLPYTRAVVDWSKLAIIIPQQNVHHTLDYIEHMTREEICERRLLAYDFFHERVKSGEARVSAIMRVLDERLRTGRLDPFQYAPGISTHSDSLAVYKTETAVVKSTGLAGEGSLRKVNKGMANPVRGGGMRIERGVEANRIRSDLG